MNVLITGARAPIACDLARAFYFMGHQVFTTDSLRRPIGRFVPEIEAYLRLPAPARDFSGFEADLTALCRQHAIDLVVPTSEEVFWLAQCKRLRENCKVLIPDAHILEQLHHKGKFAELANGLGYGAGPCQELSTPEQLQLFARTATLSNWVLKPVYSRFATRVLISPSPAEVATLSVDPTNPWLAQPRAAGDEVCLYNVAHDGKLLLHVAYRPRYRAGAGASIYFEPVDDPRLVELSAAIARATGFTGQLSFDVMQDGDRLVALECNPRGTSGVHLAMQRPEELVRALQGSKARLNPKLLEPRRLGLAMLAYHGWKLTPRQYFAECNRAKDALAAIPKSAQVGAMLEVFWRALLTRKGVLAASTEDIEWNGSVVPPGV